MDIQIQSGSDPDHPESVKRSFSVQGRLKCAIPDETMPKDPDKQSIIVKWTIWIWSGSDPELVQACLNSNSYRLDLRNVPIKFQVERSKHSEVIMHCHVGVQVRENKMAAHAQGISRTGTKNNRLPSQHLSIVSANFCEDWSKRSQVIVRKPKKLRWPPTPKIRLGRVPKTIGIFPLC